MNITNTKLDSFSVIGITTRTSNKDEFSGAGKIAELWHRFYSENVMTKIQNKVSDKVLAVYHNYENDANGEYSLMIGLIVDKNSQAPDGLTKIDIPAQDYTNFTSNRGAMPGNIIETWQEVWKSTESKSITRAYSFDFEVYDERAMDPTNSVIDVLIAK